MLGELRGQDRWLLVFDNAEAPASLTPFLPGSGCHVVITSRNPRWQAIGAAVEIGEFTRAESVSLVRSRVPGMSDVDADALADAVGDLPLVVDQAAALLADTGWSVPTYLALLRERMRDVLLRHNHAGGYAWSVAASWQLAFDRLADTDPATVQALTVAAWLAPEPIPLTVFTDHPEHLPDPLARVAADPLGWADVLGLLRDRALARITTDSLLLHRIPAALLRAASPTPAPDQGSWAATAARVLQAVVPADPNATAWKPGRTLRGVVCPPASRRSRSPAEPVAG